MRWRIRTGAPWRDVPERYGLCDQGYDLFRCWQRVGTRAWNVTQLRAEAEAKGLITWDVNVNSPRERPDRVRADKAYDSPPVPSPSRAARTRATSAAGMASSQ